MSNKNDRKTKRLFDNVTKSLLTQNKGLKRDPETGVLYEEPLKNIHPGLDLALMYAQPGSIIIKALAPPMAKSTLNSIKNGNILEAFSPGIKSTIGAEILGLPKGIRRNLSLNDLQLKSIVGKGDEATVFNTGLTKRYVIKIERPDRSVIGGYDYVKKSLDIPKIASENGARTYHVGKIGDKNVLLQEKVYPFTKEKSFESLTKDSGLILDRELHDAYNPQKRWWWIDARPSNSGVGIDGKLKIIDGVVDTFKQGGILKAQPGKQLIDRINNTSNANFVSRLKDPNRQVIKLGPGKIGTHLMGYITEDNYAIVFPQIQEVNGKLRKLPIKKAIKRAISTGDTLHMTVPEAEWFTTNYKQYYPNFDEK